MDEEDFERLFNMMHVEEGDPTFRATYRNGRLTVLRWWNMLIDNGPSSMFFAQRERAGTVIADLTCHQDADGMQLAVAVRSGGRNVAEAEEEIVDWAAAVGFQRVWLSDRFVEIDPEVSPHHCASVKCPTCGQKWSGAGNSFWAGVRGETNFPLFCPLCGGDLPAWRVDSPAK